MKLKYIKHLVTVLHMQSRNLVVQYLGRIEQLMQCSIARINATELNALMLQYSKTKHLFETNVAIFVSHKSDVEHSNNVFMSMNRIGNDMHRKCMKLRTNFGPLIIYLIFKCTSQNSYALKVC